jgi:hypothetical protein
MKRLAFVLIAATALFAQDPKTSNQNMVRQRGQTPVQDNRESMSYGRVGKQQMMPQNEVTVTGVLVDGSCENRTALNFRSRPVPLPPMQAPAQTGAISASGVSVSPQTVENERADVSAHLVPDILARQEDPTCAVTGTTSGYAVFTDSGRLLNLDQGGNTLAAQAILGNTQGRAMLNGQGPGIKPRVVFKGWVLDDRLIVDTVQRLGQQ